MLFEISSSYKHIYEYFSATILESQTITIFPNINKAFCVESIKYLRLEFLFTCSKKDATSNVVHLLSEYSRKFILASLKMLAFKLIRKDVCQIVRVISDLSEILVYISYISFQIFS